MLTRLLVRSKAFRRQGQLSVLVAAMVVALFTAAGSYLLTPEQMRARDYGEYEHIVSAGTLAPGEAAPALCDDVLEPAGASRCDHASLFQADFAGVGEISVTERRPEGFPGAYVLLSGRWPANPGEVAISQALPDVAALDAAHGAVRLSVVGRFREVFSTEAREALVAPGTWAATTGGVDTAAFPSLTASGEYLVSGVSGEKVAEALRASGYDLAVRSASEIADRDVVGALGLVGQLPLILIPLMSGLLAAAWTSRWRMAVSEQLWRIGIARRTSACSMFVAGLLTAVGSGCVGVIAGWLLAVVARPLLAPAVKRPLAPVEVPWLVLGIVLAGLLAGYLVGMIRLPAPSQRGRLWRRVVSRLPAARRVSAVGAGAAVAARLITTKGPEDVTQTIIVAVLLAMLVAPDLIGALAARRWNRPATRLGCALLRRNTGRGTALAVALVAMLSFCGAATAALNTFVAMDNAANPDRLPPGTITLGERADYPLPADLKDRFESYAGLADPVAVTRRDVDQTGFPGIIVSVADVDSLKRVLKADLTSDMAAAIDHGALVVREPGAGQVRTAETARYESLPEVGIDYPRSLPFGAVTLDNWARQRGWDALDVGYYYVGASPGQLALAQSAAQDLGVDESFISFSREADEITLTPAFLTATAGLSLGLLLLVMLLAGAQGKELRPYLARLRSIGLPRSWARQVVLVQLLMIIGVAAALAALVTAVTVGGLIIVNDAPPVVPWLSVAALAGSLAVGLGGGVLLGTLRLRSAERLSEA